MVNWGQDQIEEGQAFNDALLEPNWLSVIYGHFSQKDGCAFFNAAQHFQGF
jgi:hypothetical protein